jgi:hypothetical protein
VLVNGRRERRLDFATWGSGIPRDARVERDVLEMAGVLFPDDGDWDGAVLLLPGSVSGVDESVLEIDSLCEVQAGLLASEVGSKACSEGIRWDELNLPNVPSGLSALALSRALVRMSCSFFAASLGSDAL